MPWTTTPRHLVRLTSFDDDVAWRDFVVHFEPILAAHARRSRIAPDEVEDVVQDTLLAFALALQRGRFDPDRGDLLAWLLGIARREEASTRRRASFAWPRAQSSTDAAQPEARPPVAENDVVERQWTLTRRCLERVRRETAASTWECFELNVLQGLGAVQVAARLRISSAHVHDTRYRIMQRLKRYAQEFGDPR